MQLRLGFGAQSLAFRAYRVYSGQTMGQSRVKKK